MNAEEIVRALRNCKAYKTKSDLQTTMLTAADLIESLQAQLAERDKEIERLREAQRWIPVTERLPETTTVLGCNKYGVVEPVLYMSNAKRWVVMPNARVRIDVTHWMPLPEPPRKDDEA